MHPTDKKSVAISGAGRTGKRPASRLASLLASLARGTKMVVLLSGTEPGKRLPATSAALPTKRRDPKSRKGKPAKRLVRDAGALSAEVWASIEPSDDPSVERTVSRVVQRVPEIVRARRQEMTESEIDTLVELFLGEDPLSEARSAIKMDNARERVRFLDEVPCFSSKQVAENAGHRAANASVTSSRWKRQGKIFSVPWKGSEVYPAFQFRDGQPHPNVAKVLRELPEGSSPWQIAFWFTSSNGWLQGAAPADRLNDEAALLEAARRENEPIVG